MIQNKYKEGESVCAKEFPLVKLTVRRYVDMIYYCRMAADPESRDLVYFERELTGAGETNKKA